MIGDTAIKIMWEMRNKLMYTRVEWVLDGYDEISEEDYNLLSE